MIAVGFAHTLHDDRIIAAAGRGRELESEARGVFFVDLHEFQLLEHAHAALHLVGFGVSTLEAFDVEFRFGYHLLLLLILFLLLCATLLAQFEVLGVAGFVIVDAAERDLDGAGGDVVDKLTVVADDDNRLAGSHDEIFEPADTFDVEVVGRLVE